MEQGSFSDEGHIEPCIVSKNEETFEARHTASHEHFYELDERMNQETIPKSKHLQTP